MLTNAIKKIIIPLLVSAAIVLSGCGKISSATPIIADDLLAKVLARGTIVVATDPGYPPQSELVPGAKRTANTKCASNETTANELTGFDIATSVEIAKRLGVEACFVTPQWSQITAGNWDGRWDISVGSMTITEERLEVLYFTQPYYAAPAAVFVHKDNTTFKKPADLSGKRVGVCTGCGYEDYLRGKLDMPNNPVEYLITDPEIVGYQVDVPALEDLAIGDGVNLDGIITAQPTGLEAIKNGLAIKQLGEPVFFEYLAAAMDKKSNQNSISLAMRATEIIRQMHADGTLAKFTQQYYGMDYATIAGKYDIAPLEQFP